MATEPTNEFPLPKNSYAAFDAISLRNLIIERLNDQGIFTDQNYIGSNLAAVIDIVSYAFNTLLFYLNRTSTESTFTEAQLYENISRIVKLLDYKPIGYQTSTVSFQCSADNTANSFDLIGGVYIIPRYSYLTVGNTNFSFNEDLSFTVSRAGVAAELTDLSNKKLLFQGTYVENPLYLAAGDENETITINTSNALIDHFNIDVYVYEQTQNKWIQYLETPNLYTEQPYTRKFEKRLNQNLLYDITFGNNINGRKLEEGDRVAIYYLQSSGENGVIGPNMLAERNVTKTTFSTANFRSIITDLKQDQEAIVLNNSLMSRLFFNNTAGSTIPKNIETAESIRKNAPSNFKSQYRLVTLQDYETFIRTNFDNFIADAKVFNNWDYISLYLKYFRDIQVTPTAFRQILLNQVSYADACNFNNVYICCVPKVARGSTLKYLLPAQKELILSNAIELKTLTTEINFIDPIFKAVSFGVKPTDGVINVQDTEFTQLVLVKTPGNNRANQSIITDVANVFKQFFDPTKQTIGGILDINLLTSQILSVDGVSSFVTRQGEFDEEFSGLSLFMWNPTYPDLDKTIVTTNVTLRDFEFLYYEGLSGIANNIAVIEQSYANTRF